MGCIYRMLDKSEIDLLSTLRLEFVKDVHPEYDDRKMEAIAIGTYRYIKEYVEKDMYIGFVGEVDNQIACSASLLIFNFPPLFSSNYRRIGYVINFYTRLQFRNKGYGSGLMEYIKDYSKAIGLYKLELSATKAGYPLYQKCGFLDAESYMEYQLYK